MEIAREAEQQKRVGGGVQIGGLWGEGRADSRRPGRRRTGRNGNGPTLPTNWRVPRGAGDGGRERDTPRRLSGRHSGRSGVRGLPCVSPAWAPSGTSTMLARTPRAPRALCGEIPRERRGTAPPLRCPNANCGAWHTKRGALEAMVQADPGLRSPGRVNRKEVHRRHGPTQSRVVVQMGPEQPGCWATTRCHFSEWFAVTLRDGQLQLAGVNVCLWEFARLAESTPLWGNTGRTGTWRRRTRSC